VANIFHTASLRSYVLIVHDSTSSHLVLAPRTGQQEHALGFSLLRVIIKDEAPKIAGLDPLHFYHGLLLVGRTRGIYGRHSLYGVNNSQEDGVTFTQDLSRVFKKLMAKESSLVE
jgi:hypothetical protein